MSMRQNCTLVYYYIPSDSDDPSFPNAFPVSKSQDEIKLRDIKEKFPLPGQYHFRFKLKWNDNTTIWMDVTNEDSKVPNYNDKVICKVLRTSWQGGTAPTGSTKLSQGRPTNLGQKTTSAPTGPASQVPAAAKPPSNASNMNRDLLFGGDSPKSSAVQDPSKNNAPDLLFDSFSSAPPPQKKNDDFDLFK